MKTPASAEADYPSQGYAWFVVFVLFAVTLFSQLDRQLPALLVTPLREAFDLSDTQFSLLQGYAFALVYTLAGLPLGRLVDRAHRRNLIIVGLAVWSIMTALSGFAQNYAQLVVCRMGVGVGEAVLAPAAYSIIADYVPPSRRGRALGVYYVSLAIGSGASLILGGLIFRLIGPDGLVVPIFGHLDQWRAAFIVAGAPGLLLIGALLGVKEPKRRDTARVELAAEEGSIRELLAYLSKHSSTFARVLPYPAVIAIIGYGALAWAPALLQRRFAMAPSDIGIALGATVALGGFCGTLLSAFLSDRWALRAVPAARLRVTLVGWVMLAPAAIIWPIAPSPAATFALVGLLMGAAAITQAAAPAVVQEITPNRMRGQVIAIYLLLGGLLGIGLGPTAIALVTDFFFRDDAMLHWSIVVVSAPLVALGAWLCWSALVPFERTRSEITGALGGSPAP